MRDSGDWRLLFFHAARLLLVSAYSRFFTAESLADAWRLEGSARGLVCEVPCILATRVLRYAPRYLS